MIPAEADLEGWMLPEQLDWLKEQARQRYRILELGAWKGRTTAALASATPGKVWVVDCWDSTDPEDAATDFIREEGRESVFQQFLMNMRPWAGKLVVMNMESHEAWKRCGHLQFDMIWIDADHRFAAVRQQLQDWRARLAPGGLLCGHDGEMPDVRRAVDELAMNMTYFPFKQPSPYEHRAALIWAAT